MALKPFRVRTKVCTQDNVVVDAGEVALLDYATAKKFADLDLLDLSLGVDDFGDDEPAAPVPAAPVPAAPAAAAPSLKK